MKELLKSVLKSKLFLVITVLVLIYIYLKKVVYSYWKRYQIPHDDPALILGTVDKKLLFQKITVGKYINYIL
jgi:hypothetical protein